MYVSSILLMLVPLTPAAFQTICPVAALTAYVVLKKTLVVKIKPLKATIVPPAEGICVFHATLADVGPGPALAYVPSGVLRILFHV